MPSRFEWTEAMSTGVDEIDWQHRECIRMINVLLDNDLENDDKELVKKGFKFLVCYVREHFQLEEQLMRKSKYPKADFDQHKAFHEYFKKEVHDLWREHDMGRDVSMKLSYLLVDLFANHICALDKKMSKHLIAKMEEGDTIGAKLKALLAGVIGK